MSGTQSLGKSHTKKRKILEAHSGTGGGANVLNGSNKKPMTPSFASNSSSFSAAAGIKSRTTPSQSPSSAGRVVVLNSSLPRAPDSGSANYYVAAGGTINSLSVSSGSAGVKRRRASSSVPDFSKLHAKQFSGLKPISECRVEKVCI